MPSQRNKIDADVLDYQAPDQPESKRVKRLFRVTIAIFVLFFVSSLTILILNQRLLMVYYSNNDLLFKVGFVASKISVPLGLLLAIIGLYKRHRYGYLLVGAFIGLSIFNLFTRIYSILAFGNQSIEEVPDIKLIELSLPVLLIAYLIYFYINTEVIYLIGSSRTNRVIFISLGLLLAGLGYIVTHHMG